MRTETPTPGGPALARLRAGVVRTRRRLTDRARAWGVGDARAWRDRWPVAVAAVAVVAALGLAVAASLPVSSDSVVFIRSGEAFSDDDLKTIARALDGKKVPYRVGPHNRVGVAADRLDEVGEILSKLSVGPRTLPEIERWAMEPPGLLDAPGSKEDRQAQARNQLIAEMIRPFDGVASAWVSVSHPKPRGLSRTTQGATALVYLGTVDDREISYVTVQKIKTLIASFDPEVKQDAVSVFDRKGHLYANAQDPTVTAQARDRARQEGFEQDIAREIDWIHGVQVSVRFAPASVPMPVPPTTAAAAAAPPPAVALPLPAPAESRPSVGVNRPMDLTADNPPAPAASPGPTPSAHPDTTEPPSRARVWVKVPHSFYLKWPTTHKDPSIEDLQPLVSRTEQQIETAVRHVVPGDQLGEVKVSTLPDEAAAAPPVPASADARRVIPWWVPAAGAGATTALVMGLAFRVVTRRPALRGARRDRGRYKIDEADDSGPSPGPSERVRELIRLNPEAAASVLVRWTGQGGPT